MSISAFAARRRGFTLIELLIVIVVIAILALIVIPRVMGASRKAKEATLKGNLHEIRNALEQFQADTGGYPTTANLIDIVAPSEAKLPVNESGGRVRRCGQRSDRHLQGPLSDHAGRYRQYRYPGESI